MDIGKLTEEQKEEIWDGVKSQEYLMEGFPYLKLGSKEAFFGEGEDPTRGASLKRRLYHTLFPKTSNLQSY